MRSRLHRSLSAVAGFACAMVAACATLEPSSQAPEPRDRPVPYEHRDCFSGGAFLPADMDLVSDALPDRIVPLDGGELMPAFQGHALLGIAAWSCRAPDSTERYSFTLIVSLVEPPVDAEPFDSVRLHWYEHARIVDNDQLYRSWQSAGLDVVRGQFRYDRFLARDSVARFAAVRSSDAVFEIGTNLDRTVDFPGQTLAFWQARSEQLYYSLFQFERHRSWIGGLSDCVFDFGSVLSGPLANIACPDRGLTEVIEHVEFTSSVSEWSDPPP